MSRVSRLFASECSVVCYFFMGRRVRPVLPVDVDGVGTTGDGLFSLAARRPFLDGVVDGVSTFVGFIGVLFVGVFAFAFSVNAVAVLLEVATMGVLPDDFRF